MKSEAIGEETGGALVSVAPIEVVGIAPEAIADVGDCGIKWSSKAHESHGEDQADEIHDLID